MKTELFYQQIVNAMQKRNVNSPDNHIANTLFLKELEALFKDENLNMALKMTTMSILFEGFYRSIAHVPLKKQLTSIRLQRWNQHFGTPTITFLLTFSIQIEETRCVFIHLEAEKLSFAKPWNINQQTNLVIDSQNNILIDKNALATVVMPEDEKVGHFIKTHNPSGGFTTAPCDPVSRNFIEYVNILAKRGGVALEIGAGFGAASLEVRSTFLTIFCNDIEPNNLAVVRNRYLKKVPGEGSSVTGDNASFVLLPGSFPDELAGLPSHFFDAILICRVLHFFKGEEIEKSLAQLMLHLKPGGKLFIVCETPFLKNWQRFIPEYEKRITAGIKWPGEIINPADYESSGRAASLPNFVHWITKEVLKKTLTQLHFRTDYLSYINRQGQFPDDLLLDGRESIGAIAVKPC